MNTTLRNLRTVGSRTSTKPNFAKSTGSPGTAPTAPAATSFTATTRAAQATWVGSHWSGAHPRPPPSRHCRPCTGLVVGLAAWRRSWTRTNSPGSTRGQRRLSDQVAKSLNKWRQVWINGDTYKEMTTRMNKIATRMNKMTTSMNKITTTRGLTHVWKGNNRDHYLHIIYHNPDIIN